METFKHDKPKQLPTSLAATESDTASCSPNYVLLPTANINGKHPHIHLPHSAAFGMGHKPLPSGYDKEKLCNIQSINQQWCHLWKAQQQPALKPIGGLKLSASGASFFLFSFLIFSFLFFPL
jgi:hypothetical protein